MKHVLAAMASLCMAMTAPNRLAVAADSRPNILYIMADDHAVHAISAYGSKVNKTPHIDRLGKEGMRFNNCLVTNCVEVDAT